MNNDLVQHDVFYTHRVSYGETDVMGVLYYAEYAHIYERSRGEFCRSFGLSYKEMETRGIKMPVSELSCRYKKPAQYDDLLHVRVWISEWRGASLKFSYELYDEDKKNILATAFTVHAVVDESGKPIRIPTWIKEALKASEK